MPIELEAKMKVANLSPVRERLRNLGAEPRGRVLERNTFFDSPDRKLLVADSGLRLRHTRDLDRGEEKDVVTFKGPQGAGELKRREEIEFGVTHGAAASEMFGRLGYTPDLSFEKRRETWRLGDCTIELDELPNLGTFVEIEGPDENVVLSIREKLGLSGEPLVTIGYATMVAKWLKQHPDQPRVMRF
jgi:adenylate cyclase class 2